jgi:hypothetical protein
VVHTHEKLPRLVDGQVLQEVQHVCGYPNPHGQNVVGQVQTNCTCAHIRLTNTANGRRAPRSRVTSVRNTSNAHSASLADMLPMCSTATLHHAPMAYEKLFVSIYWKSTMRRQMKTKCQIGRRAYFPPGHKARTQSADNLLAAVVVEHAEAPLVHFLAKRLEERLRRGKHCLAQTDHRLKILLD